MDISKDKQTVDTIFALATAPGRAGVAVVRISGDASFDVVQALTTGSLPSFRRMSLRTLSYREEVLDDALVVIFESGASFTGEAMAELHLHGGRATAQGVLSALSDMKMCRTASPGEFTRRAMENGRLDLAQVEGLADLIDAETEAQRVQAMALMKGDLSDQAQSWRADLIGALALLEASIDFADEDDAPVEVEDEVAAIILEVKDDLSKTLAGSDAAERIRDGFVVALVGAPNAGKSSLLNVLVGREAAISSPVAGTTRDVIEVNCDFGGLPVILTDMAGLRSTDDEVEGIGVDRALARAEGADLRVFLAALDAPRDRLVKKMPGDIDIWTKADLDRSGSGLKVSSVSREGLPELKAMIGSVLATRAGQASLLGRVRQKESVQAALKALDQAYDEPQEEIRSALLRTAVSSLSELLGEVGVEDVLDDIFSRFCMGK